jgi:hypothetical protein
MIVSHSRKFVFIHVPKAAGSSLSVALASIAGDDAIVTPLEDRVEGFHARNFSGWFNPLPELAFRPRLAGETLGQLKRRQAFYSHMPWWRIRNRIGRAAWRSYFKFCFERDPWERITSMYFYLRHHHGVRSRPGEPSFDRWLEALIRRQPEFVSPRVLYSDSRGNIQVDFVGRYESLRPHLAKVLQELGFSESEGAAVVDSLPTLKSQYRQGQSLPITERSRTMLRSVFDWDQVVGHPDDPDTSPVPRGGV